MEAQDMGAHSVGKTIAALRKAKGWTQAVLAAKLGVSDKAISKWESEAGLPEISQLPAMATLFNVTIDYLMMGKSPEKDAGTIPEAELCCKPSAPDVTAQQELQIQSAIHNGILSIQELKKINNFALIKKALYEYPIHVIEILYKFYREEDWRKLFEFAVDNADSRLSDALIEQGSEDIEKRLLRYWQSDGFNKEELYISLKNRSFGNLIERKQMSLKEVVDYLQRVRGRILDELSIKFNKKRIIDELTKDYFYAELSKGNKEIVIVKLCVRMEAILKYDYHFEGDFSEMLSKFCSMFNTTDDEGNNFDPHTPAMLNKLRLQRNSIVHSERVEKPMSDEEIKRCIDYICSFK